MGGCILADDMGLRTNLQLCLRGSAMQWYSSELTDREQKLISYAKKVRL